MPGPGRAWPGPYEKRRSCGETQAGPIPSRNPNVSHRRVELFFPPCDCRTPSVVPSLYSSSSFTPLAAQQADSGVVQVAVAEPMGPVEGVLIRAAGRSAQTDAAGNARLVLPVGRQVLSLARIGYQPRQVTVVVVRDSVVAVKVEFVMDEMAEELEEIRVSTTRIERLAGETPIRVEVLDEMEVDENTLMAPSGITMLLNETPGDPGAGRFSHARHRQRADSRASRASTPRCSRTACRSTAGARAPWARSTSRRSICSGSRSSRAPPPRSMAGRRWAA